MVFLNNVHRRPGSRDSSVVIATRYGLDGPVIESQWGGEILRTCPDRLWGTPSLLYNAYRIFPVGKAVEAWRRPPTPSSAEVKEGAELYHYPPIRKKMAKPENLRKQCQFGNRESTM